MMINPIVKIDVPKNVYNNIIGSLSDIIELAEDMEELCNPTTNKGSTLLGSLEDISERATAIHDILITRATYPVKGK